MPYLGLLLSARDHFSAGLKGRVIPRADLASFVLELEPGSYPVELGANAQRLLREKLIEFDVPLTGLNPHQWNPMKLTLLGEILLELGDAL